MSVTTSSCARKQSSSPVNMRGIPVQDFINLYDRSSNRAMKEQLIFLYSQRREREVVDKMLDIARSEKDRELQKKAIFWLGQSKDPRVVQLLQRSSTANRHSKAGPGEMPGPPR